MAALFQAQEPEDGGLDRLADGEEAVVLEQRGFARAEGGGDVAAFGFGEDDAVEGRVEGVVLRHARMSIRAKHKTKSIGHALWEAGAAGTETEGKGREGEVGNEQNKHTL